MRTMFRQSSTRRSRAFRYMFIQSVYDFTGAFGIVGCNHLGTVGTVEKQHANYPSLTPITGSAYHRP
jgi:hypothetical protein